MIPENQHDLTRRKFIYNAAAVGAGVVLASPLISRATGFIKTDGTYTVQQIIDLFIKDVPGGAIKNTIDTIKTGSGDTKVTGIVTTMFATVDVIRKAIALGANFIIAHEPTFYNHADDTAWLQTDAVYQYKANLIKEHNIAIWRNHDYIHTIKPDGVTKGVLAQLGWQQYADKNLPNIITLPQTTVKQAIDHTKAKLHIEKVRFNGDPEQSITRVLFLPGSAGGQRQIKAIEQVKPELVLCGEVQEWETTEYIRDARAKGDKIALALLGHIASEEPGSQFMLEWLNKKVPGVKATHVNCGNSFSFL